MTTFGRPAELNQEVVTIKDFVSLFLQVVDKLPVTLLILVFSLAFGLAIGVAVALVRIRKEPVSYAVATFYISFTRCTPILIQLFLVYFGLPPVISLLGINISGWDRLVFVIITFSFHAGAAFSEIIRSAYISVGESQLEAAYSVGMTYFQALERIVLPQAFVIALPNMVNEAIMMLKDTSLAFTIGVVDVMGQVSIISANNYGMGLLEIYVVISIIYWAVGIAMEGGMYFIEVNLTRTKLIGR
jgi:L-cystine transport system permease protein